MKIKTKRQLQKYLIMGGIFLLAMLFYIMQSYRSMEKSNTVYAALSEARLPLVYVEKDGRELNLMYGYLQDMGMSAEQELLTVLPENRALQLRISERQSSVASIRYEIRSLDLQQLIETGTVSGLDRSAEGVRFQLPIQNLIRRGQQYLLRLTVDIGEHSVYYYTRIVWQQNDFSEQMLSLAEDFTKRSFSKSEARSLSSYLETTDTADNSSLSHVTLKSSFQQITFGDTGMQPASGFYIRLKELEGVMGEVQIRYLSSCTDSAGNPRQFWNEDNYVFRYDPQRIFIMSFDRRTEETLHPGYHPFEGEKLLLGVQDMERLETMSSDSGQFTAFQAAKSLYRYENTIHGKLLTLFSFASETEAETSVVSRADYRIRLLSAKNNGDVDFIVYGYMSRGQHEGYSGIAHYTYDNSEDTVTENFFLPIPDNADQLAEDVERLSYSSGNGLFYFYYNGSIYGVDSNSFEVVTVAEGLSDWELASSEDCRYIAFQDRDSTDSYHSEKLSFMDLFEDRSTELREEGKYLRTLGFIGEDLVYGVRAKGLPETLTLRMEEPMTGIRIVDTAQQLKSDYQKEGIYFGNAEVTESRVHFDEYRYDGESYQSAGDDSIISNRENENSRQKGLKSYQDSELQKCWYLEIRDVGQNRPEAEKPGKFSTEKTASIEIIRGSREESTCFYAYALGDFRGRYRTLEEAYRAVYEDFGYVKDEKGDTLWNRTDKETFISIRNPLDRAGELLEKLPTLQIRSELTDGYLLNAYGMDLNSVLYYVGKGLPAAAYTADGTLELITGYSSFNVTLLNPADGSVRVLGREEAAQHFGEAENRFAVMVETQ